MAHGVKSFSMIIRVLFKHRLCHAFIQFCHLNFEVLVEIFIPKDDIIRILSFVMSNFLQICIHFFGAPVVIKGRFGRSQFILIVRILMRIVGSWTLSHVPCTIVIKVLFVG